MRKEAGFGISVKKFSIPDNFGEARQSLCSGARRLTTMVLVSERLRSEEKSRRPKVRVEAYTAGACNAPAVGFKPARHGFPVTATRSFGGTRQPQRPSCRS
jgi:hypothetical protein